MQQIRKRQKEISRKFHAEGTTEAYETAAKQWIEFCQTYGHHTREYHETNLCLFIIWLDLKTEKGIKAATAKNKLYGIREFAYQTYNDLIEVDHRTMSRLGRLRKSIAIHNPATNGSEPITMEMLQQFINIIDMKPIPEWQKQTEKTMLIIAFSEIKRSGEYVMDDKANRSFKHGHLTQRYNMDTHRMYLDWKRKDGKTNRDRSESNALHTALVCKCKKWGSTICPIHNLEKLIKEKQKAGIPTGPNDDIFVVKEKGKIKPYNKYMAGHLLKRMVKEAGYPQGPNDPKYTLHGFRKGGAIQATKDGIPISTIMKQADWRSGRMVQHYQRQINIADHATNLISRYG